MSPGNHESHPYPYRAAQFRAKALSRIRDFFTARDILEVETPLLSRGASHDFHIDVFPVDTGEASPRFLQTSPEPHMKRMLARGYPDIFQICKAFRAEEEGRHHNPEFTMVEWYRKDFSLPQMMEEAVAFCQVVTGVLPVVFISYAEAFSKAVGLNPFSATREELLAHTAIARSGLALEAFPQAADVLNFLMSEVVEPAFDPGTLTVVHGFPLRLSSQALPDPDQSGASLRFEIFGGGMELGNGYQELQDVQEYHRRFEAENQKRQMAGKTVIPSDKDWFSDMEKGLPSCCGVALGLDRLILLATGGPNLSSILEFQWKNA